MESAENQKDSTPEKGVPDMTTISNIDENGINQNLKARYEKNQIYTYTGTILITVNPYKALNVFSKNFVYKYHQQKLGCLEPHIYALAEAAYKNIRDANENQSCVISGESGAGKTETAKFILQYLCTVTRDVSTWIQQQILEANTILESFGNAKTVRNDNSSRFGKFMQVCFDSQNCIKGCVIQDYLLEQSRITFQSPGEQNYHVLYQLVAEGQKHKEMADSFYLKEPSFYKYLNAFGNVTIDTEIEAKKFEGLRMAFSVLQISQVIIDGIIKVLSAILWLGNLDFCDIDGERCEFSVEDHKIIDIIAELLGLNKIDLQKCCLSRQINVRGNITEIPLKFHEARENRHAMAKALYSRSFAWLIGQINTCINPGQDHYTFLGVLDIFGFENFEVNSFEQLCINYANEKLHKFFNHYVFALEQELYKLEELSYSHIEFTDNTLCLELIERPPRCIFKLLTEQCHLPKGSDLSYLLNLHSEFESNPRYFKGSDRRHWESEFGIHHYAGCVLYCVKGFVEKNRDVQQDVLFDLMGRSENTFVTELSSYKDLLSIQTASSTVQRGTFKGKLTVSDTFRQQLQALVDVLQNTKPWYVRCIKPNSKKMPNEYNDKLVLDQLKYLGMLDIIRIRREGFPIHFTFLEFRTKYKCLVKVNMFQPIEKQVLAIVRGLNVSPDEWQLGKSKIFLRNQAYEPLEDLRLKIINGKAIIIQRSWKCLIQLKKYRNLRQAVVKIQHAYRGWKLRIEFLRKKRAIIIIQSHLRGVFAREVALALREMRRVDEEMRKRERFEIEKKKREKQLHLRSKDEDENKAIEECERLVNHEIVVLSQMADQINSNLKQCRPHYIDDTKNSTRHIIGGQISENHDSVDLDNLFAFLSEVPPSNLLIDEINCKMDTLVQDLDYELENVIQQEIEEMSYERPAKTAPIKGVPSLPEPTMPPPPPPPLTADIYIENAIPNSQIFLEPQLNNPHFPSQVELEPIYEAVVPKKLSSVTEITNPKNSMNPKLESRKESNSKLHTLNSGPQNQISINLNLENKQFSSRILSSISPPKQNKIVCRVNESHCAEREQRRKQRVDKKLQEMKQVDSFEKSKDALHDDLYYDLLEFAENYFNNHPLIVDGTIITSLTRKGKKTIEFMPKYEMITYCKQDKIPSSHIHMYDPENIVVACNIYRDLCKYSRGEISSDREYQVIKFIIGEGIEREELRDEIFVQCMRQATNNPHLEWADRIWLLICLTIVAFQPSKLLFRYFVSFVKKNLECLEGKLRQYAQWCFDNCKCTKVSARLFPPSTVEVAAMRRLGTIVCRFFFLDGRTKAIDVHPTDSASDAVVKLADKLNLNSTEGWAIYQSSPDYEEHIKSHDYLYDVIADWENKQLKSSSGNVAIRMKMAANGSSENRFVFKKRLFKTTRELSQDPVEVNMLYAQAVYSVVKSDDFPISEKVALQLAGLQAQVALGDPSHQPKPEYYTDVGSYLPDRISKTREKHFWIPILAQAHRQYGVGRTELTAKVLYLSCVMQYPLYGTTMFPVTYRGYWRHGNTLILGVNCQGVILIQLEDKSVLCEFRYCDIESFMLDPSDSFITISINCQPQFHSHISPPATIMEHQRSFVFETCQKNEIGSLIVSYHPPLSIWLIENADSVNTRLKTITNEDRIRLYQNIVFCRRQLIDSDIMRKPQDSSGGFLRNTLRRLSKHRLEKIRLERGSIIQEHGETYKGFSHSFWAFVKEPILQCLSKMSDHDETTTLLTFQMILKYAGLGSTGEEIQRAEDEHITLIQKIMDRCMQKESLLNELYFQLIKQTTDHPDPNSRVNLRHWALLSLACSVILPPLKILRKYLISHLKRCGSDTITEEGKYSRFAEKCFFRTQGTRRRQFPPSRDEIICTINRRSIHAKFHFMDGQHHSIEFYPSSLSWEVIEIVKKKIGLNENATGYGIYEVFGTSERCLLPDEKISDTLSRWEKYRNATIQASAQNQISESPNYRYQKCIFLFKKHLFVDHYMNFDDSVEKELLYHQVLHGLRSERYPITEMEAIMLVSLQGQLELGDYDENFRNYGIIASHCLPPRFVPNIPHTTIAMHHQSLRGMPPAEAKKSFLNLIQSWPLHRATIFDVMQSFTSNWPRCLWLAVDQNGIHLLEHRSRNTLCTYEYGSILSYSPNMNCLMIITGTDKKQSKIILSTTQAFQIANLIKDYSEVSKTKFLQNKITNKGDLPPPPVPDHATKLNHSTPFSFADNQKSASIHLSSGAQNTDASVSLASS